MTDYTGFQCYRSVGCPAYLGYSVFGGRCIKLNMTQVTYQEAKAMCNGDGGHLYHFKSLQQDDQPIRDLAAAEGAGYVARWVGADSIGMNGVFKWSDDTPLPDTDDVWNAGEPSAAMEQCVQLLSNSRLNDVYCDNKFEFVCQIDMF